MNNDNLYNTLAELQKNIPWINAIMRFIDVKVSNDVPIAGVMKSTNKTRYTMMINPKMLEDNNTNDLLGVIEHEVLHVLYSHLDHKWAKQNFQMANIAMDCIINETGLYTKNISLDKIDTKSIKEHFDVDFDRHCDTSLDLFNKLLNSNKNQQSQPSNFDSTSMKDLSNENGDGEIVESDNIIDDDTLSKISDDMGDNYGTIKGEIKRAVKTRQADFKNLFKKIIFNTLKQGKKSTWKRTSRRYGEGFKGKIKEKKPKILLLVDTSCSIQDSTLEKINFQVNLLSTRFDLTVIWGDTKLCGQQEVKKNQKFTTEFTGGGGTDLSFYQDIKGNFDLYIFNTDGYIPSMDIPKKSVFCIYENGKTVDNFTNIIIE